MQTDVSADMKVMPFAVEAAWVTGRWESLAKFMRRFQGNHTQDFNMSLAALFDSLLRHQEFDSFETLLQDVQDQVASSMTASATSSLHAAHDLLLKCHVLTDLEVIVDTKRGDKDQPRKSLSLLDGRLEIIGGRFSDKQYLLGVRRAAMELCRYVHLCGCRLPTMISY